jgi:hypothetical protein
MITQYSPSAVIGNRVIEDGIAFTDARRTALVGFDDATPLRDSFEAKRRLASDHLISSIVQPLSYALLRLLDSIDAGTKALGRVQGHERKVANSSKRTELIRKTYEDQLLEARADAFKKRLSFSEVLAIFKETLASTAWPDNDAAMPFDPTPQSKPQPTIAEGHRASAQRSAHMSSVKRTYDQWKEEGEAGVEEIQASKRRKSQSAGEWGYESEESA